MLELNKRYTLQAPLGTISETGIRLIWEFIQSQDVQSADWKAKNPNTTLWHLPFLPYGWDYTWVVTGRGEYVGTFPKRVSKHYYQQYQLKCPNTFLQQLGNIARQHSEDNTVYHFDFTDHFDWQDGDFGDSGSCFWGNRSGARATMENEGGLAVRFYDDNGHGMARAWLAPLPDKLHIAFNGYGYTTLKIARILAQFWGVSYKEINLTNHGTTGGVLYINGDYGYLIGPAEDIEDMSDYDLQWDTGYECDDCGRYVDEDDIYYSPGDDIYCGDCFHNHCDTCGDCGETHWRDNLNWVESDDRDVCSYCLRRHYARCQGCDDYHRDSEIRTVDGYEYCPRCLIEHTAACSKCAERHHHDGLKGGLCRNCQRHKGP